MASTGNGRKKKKKKIKTMKHTTWIDVIRRMPRGNNNIKPSLDTCVIIVIIIIITSWTITVLSYTKGEFSPCTRKKVRTKLQDRKKEKKGVGRFGLQKYFIFNARVGAGETVHLMSRRARFLRRSRKRTEPHVFLPRPQSSIFSLVAHTAEQSRCSNSFL